MILSQNKSHLNINQFQPIRYRRLLFIYAKMFYKYILFIDKILGIQKAKWNTERFPIHTSAPLTNDLPISRITSDNISHSQNGAIITCWWTCVYTYGWQTLYHLDNCVMTYIHHYTVQNRFITLKFLCFAYPCISIMGF